MHIPSAQTQALEILEFETALSSSGLTGGYDTDKWLYIPDFYSDYRYILGTRGPDPLICIGINPSTAAPDDLDPTLKSVERIAHHNGHSCWIMFNVYAQRATRPDDMDTECNETLHRSNLQAFRHILSSVQGRPTVWAAWGTIIEKRPWLPACVRDMVTLGKEYSARWVAAGKCSRKGHPHHPLYLRKDSETYDFDIDGYLSGLQA